MQDILQKPLDFMLSVASSFGHPNYRLSELSLVPITSDNRRSTEFFQSLAKPRPVTFT